MGSKFFKRGDKYQKELTNIKNEIRKELINSFTDKKDLWDIDFFLRHHGLDVDKFFPKSVANFLGKDVKTVLNGLCIAVLDDKLELKLLFKCPKCNKEIYNLKEIILQCPECKESAGKLDYYYPYFILTEHYKKHLQKLGSKVKNS